jgi:predicted nucleic acid-binding protein
MSQVTLENLEQRVAQLENRLADLIPKPHHEPGRDDWMKTIGMFRNDPVAAEVIRETLRVREEERERADRGEVE